MKVIFSYRWLYFLGGAILIVLAVLWALKVNNDRNVVFVTTQAEFGSVRQIVSVSGIAESLASANLSFPTSGTVKAVDVKKGDLVLAGDVLASIDTKTLMADRQEASAVLNSALASRDELLKGLTDTARTVINQDLLAKQTNLLNTRVTEEQKIKNAYRALLSNDLTAYTNDETKEALPPTISGTYTCEEEGQYQIDLYNSASDSGFSYRLSGLETGTYPASSRQPAPLGSCGLRILFDADSRYHNTNWLIDIPNQKSPNYLSYKNAYALSQAQAKDAISIANQAVLVTEAEAKNQTASPSSEALARANANIEQARARIQRIDAIIEDTTLTAPFDGIITKVDILPGETVSTAPIITLITDEGFDVTARVPEIDIGKLEVGQRAEMFFDTKADESVLGAVTYISPQATEIDGVAYYEATILLDKIPTWMRSGLNADIEIVIAEIKDALKLPRRFITQGETGYQVLLLKDQIPTPQEIEILFEGNDGYTALSGISQADTIVAP